MSFDPQLVSEKLKEMGLRCPICNNYDLDLNPQLHMLTEVSSDTKTPRNKGFFVAVVTCKKCHYVMNFKATNFGLVL